MANSEQKSALLGLCESDASFLKSFQNRLKDLRTLVISNIEFYTHGKSTIHVCFYSTSCILLERSQLLEENVIEIVPYLKDFDYSPEVQANGYRSFFSIVDRCCIHLLQLCRHINVSKSSLLFRSSYYLKELEAYVETTGQLIGLLGYLKQLISYSQSGNGGNLFLDNDAIIGDDVLLEAETLNIDCFYGRCLGFQFCASVQKVVQTINVAMATFSDCYQETSQIMQVATSVFNSGKYIMDQDLRGKQIVDITRTADIGFCKAFWSITDSPLIHQLRSFTYVDVEVNEVMSIEPENFELPTCNSAAQEETVMITPPCAHTGPGPVHVRLISHTIREGMTVTRKVYKHKTGGIQPKSDGLLFHCHGGGFVAQSSKSHQNYLRVWAQKLAMPILSVDYSLAPEQPFPRALEECFYAYAWVLKNPEKLGWTGKRICFAGDSAGGNLVLATALRAISYMIRVPDGIMAAYTPTLMIYTPSPSRLMALIDPILPLGILSRCIAAYAGIADKFSNAIAKPLFCNPDYYEPWEVLESPSLERDKAFGAQACSKMECNKSQHTKANDSQSVDDTVNVLDKYCVERSTNITSNMASAKVCNMPDNDVAICDSIEDLSDDNFIVCDINDFNSMKNNCETKMESFESNDNIDKHTNVDQIKLGVSVKSNLDDDTLLEYNDMNGIPVKKCINLDDKKLYDLVGNSSFRKEQIAAHSETSHSTVDGALKAIDADALMQVYSTENEETTKKESVVQDSDILHECNENPSNKNQSIEDMLADACVEDGMQQEVSLDTIQPSIPKTATYEHPAVDTIAIDNSNRDVLENLKILGFASSSTDSLNIKDHTKSTNMLRRQFSEASLSTLTSKSRYMSLDLEHVYTPKKGGSSITSPDSVAGSEFSPKLVSRERMFTPKRYPIHRKMVHSPVELFRHLPVVRNHYMSPLLAPDDLLLGLPHIHLVACHFDPLLDDSITFAKKLSKLGKSVSLKVFDNLPHGFLSFSDASLEAQQAAIFCLDQIKEVLHVI